MLKGAAVRVAISVVPWKNSTCAMVPPLSWASAAIAMSAGAVKERPAQSWASVRAFQLLFEPNPYIFSALSYLTSIYSYRV